MRRIIIGIVAGLAALGLAVGLSVGLSGGSSKHASATTATTTTTPAPTTTPSVPTTPPPATNQPFPTSVAVSNFPAGQLTIRLKIDGAVTDAGWAKYTMYIANRTARDKLFTQTALAVILDGRVAQWTQTADNKGGFGFADSGHWWIRTGTMRSGRVIKITGMVHIPDRKQFVSGNPLRDANIACLQAKFQETVIGQDQKNWPTTYNKVDRHSCGQYVAGS